MFLRSGFEIWGPIYFGPCLAYFSLGDSGSDLFQARPDLLFLKIRRCNLGSALRLGYVSCTFRPGTRRCGLVQGRPDLFVPGSVYAIWGPLYVRARSRVLFDRALGGPIGQARSTLFLRSARNLWSAIRLSQVSCTFRSGRPEVRSSSGQVRSILF